MTDELFSLPEPEYEDEEILEWGVKDFPFQLLDVFHRFTRIPDSDTILPILVAYELMPLLGLEVVSGLFCYGPSGCGKSSLGMLMQLLNPRYDGSVKPLSALDSPNGVLQILPKYRWQNGSGDVKATPFVAMDDLTAKTLMGEIGNQKLQIIKQFPNRNGVVTKGSTDNDPVEINTFCKFLLSSVTDLGGIEGLGELNRRVIVIKHKPLNEWTESDYSSRNRNEHLEKYSDYTGWHDYPAIKLMWLNENKAQIVKDRTTVKRNYKKNRDDYPIPEVLIDFYNPLIAMGMTCGMWSLDDGIHLFERLLESNSRKGSDSHLTTILKQWLSLDEGYGKMLRRFEKHGYTFEVEYSRLVKFLKTKVSENELTTREIQRQFILGAMSDLGYRVTTVNASPLIEMVGTDDDL